MSWWATMAVKNGCYSMDTHEIFEEKKNTSDKYDFLLWITNRLFRLILFDWMGWDRWRSHKSIYLIKLVIHRRYSYFEFHSIWLIGWHKSCSLAVERRSSFLFFTRSGKEFNGKNAVNSKWFVVSVARAAILNHVVRRCCHSSQWQRWFFVVCCVAWMQTKLLQTEWFQ